MFIFNAWLAIHVVTGAVVGGISAYEFTIGRKKRNKIVLIKKYSEITEK